MKPILFLSLSFLCLINCISAQAILSNYNQTYNSVSFDLELKSLRYKTTIDVYGNKEIDFQNYQDEANPGMYALPHHDIFIALPAYSKVTLSLQEKNIVRIQGVPALNAKVSMANDSTLIYTNSHDLLSLSKKNSINSSRRYEIKGYLWIRDYYCVHISLNQYQFNGSDYIENTTAFHLALAVLNPENSSYLPENSAEDGFSDILSSAILNIKDARKLNKILYEPNLVKTNFDNWIDFGKKYLKVGVATDGIFRLTKSDLEKAGVGTSGINPNTFQMYYKGLEYPLYISGSEDNRFDTSDYIEFFGRRNMGDNYREISKAGEPYKEYLDRYTDTSTYWLTWNVINPKRTDTLTTKIQVVSDTLDYYYELLHTEENIWLDYSMESLVERQMPDWNTNQTWLWGSYAPGTYNFNFSIKNAYPNKTARVFYKIQSYASTLYNEAHKVGLSINSDPTVYDSSLLNKYEQKVLKAEFLSNLLKEGTNVLKLNNFKVDGNSVNSIGYDWYEIEYPRLLRAENNVLNFRIDDKLSKGIRILKIQNVTTDNIIIYKYQENLKRISVFFRSGNILWFIDTVKGGDRYYLTSEDKIISPKVYYQKQFMDLASKTIQAGYILITAPEFLSKAEEYSGFVKQNYSIEPKVININDIYDQFNHGFFSPEAIKTFLISAYQNWKTPKPSYVFFVGDANYDYYGNKTKYFAAPFIKNYVPSFGEPVSDTWFVVWDSTGAFFPQIIPGRLPVKSVEEIDYYLQRHKKYAGSKYDDFNKRYLFISGGDSNNESEISQLRSVNENIIYSLVTKPPIGGFANHLYKTYNPRTNFGPYSSDVINNMIKTGGLFVSYIGHSGTQIWDNGIIEPEQLSNLSNRDFLVTDFGCSSGKFAEPDVKSFSELFVSGMKSNSIGYISNSSLGFTSTTLTFPQIFYSEILKNGTPQIGNAHIAAKIKLLNQFGTSGVYKVFSLCNTLVGDPILKLKIPQKPNLVIYEKDISFSKEEANSGSDSVRYDIKYNNLGKVDTSAFYISVKDLYNGETIFEKQIKKQIPLYTDSLTFYIPTKKIVGMHKIIIKLDASEQIDELYEDDNSVEENMVISSNQMRSMVVTSNENRHNSSFRFLNPIYHFDDSFSLQYSDNPGFSNSKTITKKLDTVCTNVSLSDLISGKRYWLRIKFASSSEDYKDLFSFVYDANSQSYFIADSLSMMNVERNNLVLTDSGLSLNRKTKKMSVYSAGFYEGNYAIIDIDGNDYLAEGHLDGVHCAVFDDKTWNFLYSKKFNVWDDPANFAKNFITFLDSVPSNTILAMANSGGAGYGTTAELKKAIKTFGSKFIDSVNFRNSWAIIGKKGASIGSVPEIWSKPYQGAVKVDTSFVVDYNEGYLATNLIGPAGKWNKINLKLSLNDSELNLIPIGVKNNNQNDTLSIRNINATSYDISTIDPEKYKKLKLFLNLKKKDNSFSPVLNSIEVSFSGLPELMTNYQVVSLNRDTLQRGENTTLNFSVYNAGETKADSFKVKVEVLKPDNSRETIYQTLVDSIPAEGKKQFQVTYNTSQSHGPRSFYISIDPENKIDELYKDNNYYSIPFYIKPDTTRPALKLTFDGNDIMDGEYISSKPNIKVELSDNSFLPVTDTSSVKLTLNNKPVYYSSAKDLNITYSASNPKVMVNYSPKLNDGEYTLRVFGKNTAGNIADSSGLTRFFQVANELKLIDLYNYPNPCRGETYFTFKLTQIPEEMKIKIFTVAGRLVRDIAVQPNELRFDFNRIYWDGRDQDGDLLANGVYIYKVIMKKGDKTEDYLQKIAIVR